MTPEERAKELSESMVMHLLGEGMYDENGEACGKCIALVKEAFERAIQDERDEIIEMIKQSPQLLSDKTWSVIQAIRERK